MFAFWYWKKLVLKESKSGNESFIVLHHFCNLLNNLEDHYHKNHIHMMIIIGGCCLILTQCLCLSVFSSSYFFLYFRFHFHSFSLDFTISAIIFYYTTQQSFFFWKMCVKEIRLVVVVFAYSLTARAIRALNVKISSNDNYLFSSLSHHHHLCHRFDVNIVSHELQSDARWCIYWLYSKKINKKKRIEWEI